MTRSAGPRSARRFAGSGVRKATGTFYTPQPIAEYLIRRTLGPLVRDATPERTFCSCESLDPAMGSGAFLVAARARFLADAYEAALVRERWLPAGDLGARGARGHPADGRRAVPVRRRHQPHGRAARAPVAVAGHARGRSAAHVSRSPSAASATACSARGSSRCAAAGHRRAAAVDAAEPPLRRRGRRTRRSRRRCRFASLSS